MISIPNWLPSQGSWTKKTLIFYIGLRKMMITCQAFASGSKPGWESPAGCCTSETSRDLMPSLVFPKTPQSSFQPRGVEEKQGTTFLSPPVYDYPFLYSRCQKNRQLGNNLCVCAELCLWHRVNDHAMLMSINVLRSNVMQPPSLIMLLPREVTYFFRLANLDKNMFAFSFWLLKTHVFRKIMHVYGLAFQMTTFIFA